jgi:nucleoside-diphosphate-sugar epimerase
VDINDRLAIERAISEFQPTHVVHLAARTDLRETNTIAGYRSNVQGVANIIEILRGSESLERVVFASSMLVCRNGYSPVADTDYCPNTLYGSSKVEGERLVRVTGDFLPWTIVRPTSIWGPWFGEPYRDFFETVLAKRYFHPRGHAAPKALGFVGNTIRQITDILCADLEKVRGRTFYLCDEPAYSVEQWANSICHAAGLGAARTAPLWLFRTAATCGDVMKALGIQNPPLTSFRLRNMLTSSSFDTGDLRELSGDPPYSMDQGVAETLLWLKELGIRK